ncbi:Spo0E family sporulation regulatory protein-aspartic acid phosphatase [Priestia megaterium]|uniref:Spo0E family sporulation regulatory protein-aspartic acid phosphatase n=1 Tax=Priestia megaterium TaxID=1404 RepID=UPI003F80935B
MGEIVQEDKGVLKQTLLIEIEKAKETMIQVAREEGIASESTLQISQSIDQLLNRLHKVSLTK